TFARWAKGKRSPASSEDLAAGFSDGAVRCAAGGTRPSPSPGQVRQHAPHRRVGGLSYSLEQTMGAVHTVSLLLPLQTVREIIYAVASSRGNRCQVYERFRVLFAI